MSQSFPSSPDLALFPFFLLTFPLEKGDEPADEEEEDDDDDESSPSINPPAPDEAPEDAGDAVKGDDGSAALPLPFPLGAPPAAALERGAVSEEHVLKSWYLARRRKKDKDKETEEWKDGVEGEGEGGG